MSHGEQCPDALADSRDPKRPLISLTRSIGAYDAAESGRIHVGDLRNVYNDRLGGFFAHHLLEIEKCLYGQGAEQLEDLGARSAIDCLDVKGLGGRRHKL